MTLATSNQLTPEAPVPQRSRGAGRLSVAAIDGGTRIGRLYQQGCAKLRIPADRGNGQLEAIMINTSGGMTGGDRMDWRFEAGSSTALTLTTQASEKIYRSSGGHAEAAIAVSAGRGARLAWLPQETILFDRSALRRRIEVDLGADAEALFVESLVVGRTAMGETIAGALSEISFNDQWRVRREGRLQFAEAMSISGRPSDMLTRRAVTAGAAALATVLLVSPGAEGFLDRTRQLIGASGGASFWNGNLLARIVAPNGYQLRKTLIPLIGCLSPCRIVPKVWAL